MNIAFISPHATVAPHFETELELAQQHLDNGDEVITVSCTGQLANCDFNVDRSQTHCDDCIGRRKMGWELVSPQRSAQQTRQLVSLTPPRDQLKLDFKDVAELIDYRIDDFEIGYASLSSLVSVVRDPEPDLEKNRELLNRFLTSAWQSYQNTLQFLSATQIDRVYTFNGRFAAMRGVLRACEAAGVDCFLHERGCNKDHYEVFENHLPHDIDAIHHAIERRWNAADPQTREGIGRQWFLDRVNRVETAWKSFTTGQEAGRLPADFRSASKNIAIFCSSDDEFVAIGDKWKNSLYPNQVTAIARIASSMLEREPDTKLYLRVHPNLTDVDNQRKRDMLKLNFPNLNIIAPEAQCDTYHLLKSCDLTVSFGSSVGIEAVYWDRPSILLGPCLYQNLPGPVRSTSHEQTIELLSSDLPASSDKSGALRYGHWFQTRGFPHQHYAADNLFEGKFKEQVVYARPPRRNMLQKIRDRLARLRTGRR
jgi:hypothetical protein